MQPKTVITALAILAAFTTIAAVANVARFTTFPAWPGVMLIGLALGHLGAIAIWLARGRAHCVIRVAVAIGATIVLARWLAVASLPTTTQWLGLLAAYEVLVFTPLFLARWVGGALSNSRPAHLRQFTLAGLMLLMTNVAVLLALSRFASLPTVQTGAAIFCAIGFAAVALAVAQLSHLIPGRVVFLVGLFAVAATIGGALAFACGEPSLFIQFAAMVALQSSVVAVATIGMETSTKPMPAEQPDESFALRIFDGT